MAARRKAAPRVEEPAPAGRTWARTKAGNVKAIFTIRPEHDRALRDEAVRRMQQRGAGRPDAGEVLREVLDAWLAKRAK